MGTRLPGRRFRSDEPEVWVEDFGPTGTSDDSSTLQAAVDAAGAGLTLGFRRARYDYGSTLHIATRSTAWVGQVGIRAAVGGTELCYGGAGAAVEIGADNGHAWDANEYDGYQDHWFRNLAIRAASPNTGLALDAAKLYRAGTYGIRDWRGGGVRLESCWLEGFEYNFWGIQSDLNRFRDLVSIYSKFGIYAGPRCDQFTIADLYAFYCDRAVTVDGARQVRLICPELVGCGAGGDICGVEIRRGSAVVEIEKPWLESGAGGYQGTDGAGFVGVGLVDGYNSNSNAVKDVAITGSIVVTPAAAVAAHVRCLVRLGKGAGVRVGRVGAPVGMSVGNLDHFVLAPSGTAHTSADAWAVVSDVSSGLALTKLFGNEGTGTPSFTAITSGVSGVAVATSSAGGGTFAIKQVGAAAGADEIRIFQSGLAGEIWMQTPNLAATRQSTRLRVARSIQHSATVPPVSGVWQRGDLILSTAPSAGGFLGVVCTADGDFAGTPPTFKNVGAISA